MRDDVYQYLARVPESRYRVGARSGTRLLSPGGARVQGTASLPPIEGGGYLVTGLTDRPTYNAYSRAEQPGFLDTAAGKALIAVAIGAVVVAIGSLGGKNAPTS
jgi:hypothetical protein